MRARTIQLDDRDEFELSGPYTAPGRRFPTPFDGGEIDPGSGADLEDEDILLPAHRRPVKRTIEGTLPRWPMNFSERK